MKWENAEFACEQESVPGTAETLVVGDVLVKLRNNFDVIPNVAMHDPEEVKAVSSPSAETPGMSTYQFVVPYRLRAPGDLVTAPAITDLWEMAMLAGDPASTLPITGGITGGPISAGDIVTGVASSATGYVLQRTATGASTIPIIVLSGTFDVGGETVNASDGGSFATSAGVSAAGYGFRPADSSDMSGHAATCAALVDGKLFRARGCISDIEWSLRNGHPCIVTQNVFGAFSADGDQALFGVTAFPEASVTPPRFLNAQLEIDDYSPTGIVDVTINFPTNPGPEEDANDTAGDGVTLYRYKRTRPTIRMAVKAVATTSYDYEAKWKAGTLLPMEMTLGSSSGERWTVSAPNAQIRNIKPGMREPNTQVWEIEFGLTGDRNDELVWWQH